jgi:hypothetical protein
MLATQKRAWETRQHYREGDGQGFTRSAVSGKCSPTGVTFLVTNTVNGSMTLDGNAASRFYGSPPAPASLDGVDLHLKRDLAGRRAVGRLAQHLQSRRVGVTFKTIEEKLGAFDCHLARPFSTAARVVDRQLSL